MINIHKITDKLTKDFISLKSGKISQKKEKGDEEE